MNIVYINGQFYSEEDAKISVFDHGLLYGDGVFDTLRIYNGKPFRIIDHINRLYESAKGIHLNIPLTKEQLLSLITQTYRRSRLKDAFIRIIVTRGRGEMGVDPRTCPTPTVIVMATNREAENKGINAISIPKPENPPHVKSLNYLPNVLAKIEAIEKDMNDTIMLNAEGFISEATTENIFIVKDGYVYTTPLDSGILEGITRRVIMELWPVKEKPLTRFDLYDADEVFLTGTGVEILPILQVDGYTISDGTTGAITKKIQEQFDRAKKGHRS